MCVENHHFSEPYLSHSRAQVPATNSKNSHPLMGWPTYQSLVALSTSIGRSYTFKSKNKDVARQILINIPKQHEISHEIPHLCHACHHGRTPLPGAVSQTQHNHTTHTSYTMAGLDVDKIHLGNHELLRARQSQRCSFVHPVSGIHPVKPMVRFITTQSAPCTPTMHNVAFLKIVLLGSCKKIQKSLTILR